MTAEKAGEHVSRYWVNMRFTIDARESEIMARFAEFPEFPKLSLSPDADVPGNYLLLCRLEGVEAHAVEMKAKSMLFERIGKTWKQSRLHLRSITAVAE